MGWESLLPQVQIPNGNEGIQALGAGFNTGKAMYDTNVLRQAGQLASQGDWNGASNAALAGGNLDAGIKLNQLPIERQAQAYDLMSRAAQAATTPEQWSQLNGTMTRLFGPDSMKGFETLASRDRAITLAMTAKEQAQIAIEREKAAAATTTAQAATTQAAAHMKTANVAELTAKQWQLVPSIPGAMLNPATGVMMMPDGSTIAPGKGYTPAPTAAGATPNPATADPFYWMRAAETAKESAKEDAKLSSERASKTIPEAESAKVVTNKIAEAEELLNSDLGKKLVGTVQGRAGMIQLRAVLGDREAAGAQQKLHEILAILNAENSKMMFPGQRQTDSDLKLAEMANGTTNLADTKTLSEIMGYLKERAQDTLTKRRMYEQGPAGQKIAESADFNPRTVRKGMEAAAGAPAPRSAAATPETRPGTPANPATPKSLEEFNALPIGTYVLDPKTGVAKPKVANITQPPEAVPPPAAAPEPTSPMAPHNLLRRAFGAQPTAR